MNIFLTGGHPLYKGARGILDETEVDRAIVKELDEVLKEIGHNVTVFNSEAIKDYVEETKKANAGDYDWYIDVHANASNGEGNGVETLVYADNKPQAHKISKNIASLGFKNRGVKVRTDLYILKNTTAKALLIEVFFIDNKNDCDLYSKVGAKAIAISIAEGLTGQVYNCNTAVVDKPVNDKWISRLQNECNIQGFSNQKVDGIAGPKTLAGCPTLKYGSKGNITKLLQEKLGVVTDGIFGNATKSEVIKYQKSKVLSADGIVGQNTWRKLLNM